MKSKAVSGIMLTLLLISVLTLALNIQTVEASGTIYIRADGSVEPSTASITSTDNVTYYFTDNNFDEVVVERDNIAVDGAGFTLQGTGAWDPIGIELIGRSNVTIKNVIIEGWGDGIYLTDSSNISISGNNITNNWDGIWLVSSNNNTISGNNITNIRLEGICLYGSFNNTISGNNITNNSDAGIVVTMGSDSNTILNNTLTSNGFGIGLVFGANSNTIIKNIVSENSYGIFVTDESDYNEIIGNIISNNSERGIWVDFNSRYQIVEDNTISENYCGIYISYSDSNTIYHNNFITNTEQVLIRGVDYANSWDDGYPSGGNYWSNHVCTGNPSDGTQPYIIDENNRDHYPFQEPNGWLLPPPKPVGGKATPINIPMNKPETPALWIWLSTIILSLALTVVYVKKRKRNTETNS